MFLPTQKDDPELYPYRRGLYFAFFNALNWQVATGTPTVLFMAYLGADSFQTGLVYGWTLLLTPVHAVPADDPKGRLVHQLIRANAGLFVAHTNADRAPDHGVNDALAAVLGLRDAVPLLYFRRTFDRWPVIGS